MKLPLNRTITLKDQKRRMKLLLNRIITLKCQKNKPKKKNKQQKIETIPAKDIIEINESIDNKEDIPMDEESDVIANQEKDSDYEKFKNDPDELTDELYSEDSKKRKTHKPPKPKKVKQNNNQHPTQEEHPISQSTKPFNLFSRKLIMGILAFLILCIILATIILKI